MRIGITGASGLVGRSLTALAKKRKHEVVAFSRDPERSIPGAVEVRDFSDPENADVSGLDAVVHLAGEPILGLWTDAKRKRIRDSRILGTRGLVKAIEKLPKTERPGALVSASAVGFYGDGGDDLLDEDADLGFGYLAEIVRDWEAEVQEAADLGLRIVCGRVGIVLGQTGGAAPVLKRLFKYYLGGRLGSGKQWMSWVHIDDAARMFLRCATLKKFSGPVNFVSPNPVTNAEFTRTMAEVMHRPAFLPVPAFALKMLPGDFHEMFLFSQRVEPTVMKVTDFKWSHPDLEPALTEALDQAEVHTPATDSVAGESGEAVVESTPAETAAEPESQTSGSKT